MSLSRPLVFGNWKMHGTLAEAKALAAALRAAPVAGRGTLGVFPPATALAMVARQLAQSSIIVGAQDTHEREAGAFTGSLSAALLKDAGAEAVIIGHSERRQGHGESDDLVRAKAEAALEAGLLVVLCVGETEAEWQAGRTLERLAAQIDGSMPRAGTPVNLVVAYEPVWAIGTGRTPAAAEIERSHALIRRELAANLPGGDEVAIIYGGSVKAENARQILTIPGVDGALVGGASLDAGGFLAIYEAGRRD